MIRTLTAAVVGWAVPILTRVLVEARYKGSGIVAAVGSAGADLFRPGYNLFLVGVLNAAPLVALAALSEAVRRAFARVYQDPVHRTALAVLGGALVLATGAASSMVWRDVYGPGHHSSAAVIALVTIPMFLTASTVFLYLGIVLLLGIKGRA